MNITTRSVVFVGGIHGSGKTALCNSLVTRMSAIVLRQRHLIMEVGKEHGWCTWAEIGSRFEEYVDEAFARLLGRFLLSGASVLLVDTHYAIHHRKALRLCGRPASELFVPDLDERLVRALAAEAQVHFVLLDVNPTTARERLASRDPSALSDAYHSIVCLQAQRIYERYYMERLVGGLADATSLVLANDVFDRTVDEVMGLIMSVYSPKR
jgi:predicted kinase